MADADSGPIQLSQGESPERAVTRTSRVAWTGGAAGSAAAAVP